MASACSSISAERACRGRVALYVAMLTLGVLIASWVTRTPTIRDEILVSTGGMGLVLFGMSIGSMVGLLSSSRVLRRWGGRRVLAIGTGCAASGTAVIGLGTHAPSPFGVFVGMAALGFPLPISAAGDHPTDAVARVSAVSVAAYAAFLVGPPRLGTAGGHVGSVTP